MPKTPAVAVKHARPVILKMLTEHLDRVRAAAKQFGYQPRHIARALQGKRTMTIDMLLPQLVDGKAG